MTCQREGIKLGAPALRNLPAQSERRHWRQLVEKIVTLLGDFFRFAYIDRGWLRLAGNRGKVLLDQRARFCLIKISGNRKHGVVGRVINAKELSYVFDRR